MGLFRRTKQTNKIEEAKGADSAQRVKEASADTERPGNSAEVSADKKYGSQASAKKKRGGCC